MIKKIIIIFLAWRIGLFVAAALAIKLLPVFGNRFPYSDQVLAVTGLPPWIWGFGNFDGVHYLRIAQNGYDAQFTQAFFPLYPLLIRFFNILPKNLSLDTKIFVDPSYFFVAMVLSGAFFLLALIFFYKLTRIDFNRKISLRSLLLLLSFPTAFYFGSIYTESLFLFLVVGAFYFTRKGNFLLAGIFSALSSATRIIGLLLLPALLIEIFLKIKNKEMKIESREFTKAVIGVLLAPFGILLYMLYLNLNFENPFYFLTSQPLFGAERTAGSLVFLPQVIYRYFKIFITVPAASQLFLNAFLEFLFTIGAIICVLYFIRKIRISYLLFTLGCLLLPTLTGTLSSMPRYALMIFLLLPYLSQSSGKYFKILVCFMILAEAALAAIYVRGYWIA